MPALAAGPAVSRVAIVGLGLIGGSIAARLRREAPGVGIVGVDTPAVLAGAGALGLIDEACDAVGRVDVDLIVLATPVDATIDLLRTTGVFSGRAIVTDTCSTKRGVVSAAREAGVARFIGGHPMAGSEHAGLEHAEPELFQDRPWLLVADDPRGADAVATAAFAARLGARPMFVEAAWHDRTMAYVSHVPQLLAVALMNAAGETCGERGLAASGRAFREATRLASSPPDLWAGILRTNADYVREALDAIAAQLPRGTALVDADRIREAFAQARDWRSRLLARSELPS